MVGVKRRHGLVDLTQDDTDDEPQRKTSRSSARSRPDGRGHPSHLDESPAEVDLTIDDDESNGNETMFMTQADQLDSAGDYEQYGTISSKAVGIRYYSGYAGKGESVLLRREPHNQYDGNAIQVLNVRGEQIGHIPRQIAAKLAPYMDANDLLLEASLSDYPGEYDVSLSIKTYGPSDQERKEVLRIKMNRDKLPVDALKRRDKREKDKRAQELKKAAKAAKEASKKKAAQSSLNSMQWMSGMNHGEGNGDDSQDEESLEDIAGESKVINPREVGQAAEKFGVQEDDLARMPEADQPERIATKMLPYQLQALAWLLEKEDPQLPSEGSDMVTQLWKRKRERGNLLYTNIATNFSTKKEPELARGGILADDMGLGKTLEIISLVLADKEKFGDQGPTLIVAPVSVMSNWSQQAERHVSSTSRLRIHTYHGTGRKQMTPKDFKNFDIVITTYGTLSVEYMPKGNGTAQKIPRPKGLYSVKWRRVILDEGHNIRNPNTKNALAACAIHAYAKWALTGTPIVNSLKDLYSLVRYIGITGGLEKLQLFNSLLIRPMKENQPNAQLLLQALMSEFCLRRRKDMSFVNLKLPELTEYVHRIKFPDSERKRYDALQEEAKGTLDEFKAESGQSAQSAYRHLLEVLLRLRQVCNHWKLCEERVSSLMEMLEKQKVVDLTPENRRALQDLLQLSIEQREDCPVCLETLTNPAITHCGHNFCRDCITRVIETQHKCPMCRADIHDESKLVEPAVEYGDDVSDPSVKEEGDDDTSAKTQALLKIVSATHKKAGSKVVIFSQWCRFLDLVQPRLEAKGYGIARLDGSMPAGKRDAALRAFDSDEKITIMLASLGVCAVGLNLVVADTVVLCDSWWAPAIEDQAVDRVHRLGQTKPTTVWRLVMEDSVEERTLEIQKDKRQLMAMALKEGPDERRRREGGRSRTLGDIQRLLD